MGSRVGPQESRQSLTQRIRGLIYAPSSAFTTWLDHKLGLHVHELHGDEIVSRQGRRPADRVDARKIVAWQVHAEMGFDLVVIELEDGRTLHRIDKYNDLIDILQRVARERERPWRPA